MKVQEYDHLGLPALHLIPETIHEKDTLERCLGSENTLKVAGLFREYPQTADLRDYVVLWNVSTNREGRLPEQAGPGPEIRVVKKKADLGDFMNALRRYINLTIDRRIHVFERSDDEESIRDKIFEAATDLQKIIKPLFEEEVPG